MAKETKRTTTRTTTTTDESAAPARTSSSRRGVTKTRSTTVPSEDLIRMRAYEIFLRRNGGPGDQDGDWHQAARELEAELNGR